MRRLLVLFLLFALVFPLDAARGAMPKTMSYQGVLRRSNGNVVPDGNYQLTFRLYDSETSGTALWSEAQTVPVEDGMFSVILGSVASIDLPFDVPYWLGIQVALEPELSPRMELAGSPYAFRASVADSIEGIASWSDDDWDTSGDDIYRLTGNVGIGTQPASRLDVDGDVTASTYYGDGSHLTGIGGQALVFDTGWFAVIRNHTYQINHGLGTTSLVFSVLFNVVPSDTHAQLVMPMEHRVNTDGNRISMCGLRIDDPDNISIHTGNGELAETMDFSNGESYSYSEGYYKVLIFGWE